MKRKKPRINPKLPEASLPMIWCDFNARGWTGSPDDNCYYTFDRESLADLNLVEGAKLFIYDDDDQEVILGCTARLHRFRGAWRLQPDDLPNRYRSLPNFDALADEALLIFALAAALIYSTAMATLFSFPSCTWERTCLGSYNFPLSSASSARLCVSALKLLPPPT